jgi:hypothetical protein
VPERTIAVGELSVAESVVEADARYVVGGVLMVMHPKVEGWPPPVYFSGLCFADPAEKVVTAGIAVAAKRHSGDCAARP